MKKTNLKLLTVCGIVLLSTMLNAASYKGQKIYMSECKSCHGGGQEFSGSKRIKQWEKVFDNDGEKVAEIHNSNKKAESIREFMNDKKWKKNAGNLEDFFVEYAKDSGNVPACN